MERKEKKHAVSDSNHHDVWLRRQLMHDLHDSQEKRCESRCILMDTASLTHLFTLDHQVNRQAIRDFCLGSESDIRR